MLLTEATPDSAAPARPPVDPRPLFKSFFLGGFECSSHRRKKGRKRLDLLAATQHDVRAEADYRLLQAYGIHAARDGLRWHLIEKQPGRYDFSSFLPMLRAARDTGMQVIWDLLHYGWPDHYDIWQPEFIDAFARYVRAVAVLVREETDGAPFYTPVNEISFWAWGGGDVGYMNPFGVRRGGELKSILVRSAIAAIEAVRDVDPRARIVTAEPLINILPKSKRAQDVRSAADYNEGQFEAMDFLAGRRRPELGGRADYLDIVGLNYYYNNQWIDHGRTVYLGDPLHRPLSDMLAAVHARYQRPLFLAETGIEGSARASWLHYVSDEVAAARGAGVPVGGICLYPILDHVGWDDTRLCPNGLFCGMAPDGARTVHRPLADELRRQQRRFAAGPDGAG